MKPRYWSLAIVMVLVNYIIFATLFTMLTEIDFSGSRTTRTPEPTFTPAPAEPIIIVPTPIPTTPEPTPTATKVIQQEGNAGPHISTQAGIIQAALNHPAPSLDGAPAQPTPKYQFEPDGWYSDGNGGLTRFAGNIKDAAGNPVNGVSVEARCGDYAVISNPSGAAGWGESQASADWPAGFYDLTIDTKPVPCVWVLTIVDTDDGKTVKAILSQPIPVQITSENSIVTANWRKNW
jgi:hypothetical protein